MAKSGSRKDAKKLFLTTFPGAFAALREKGFSARWRLGA